MASAMRHEFQDLEKKMMALRYLQLWHRLGSEIECPDSVFDELTEIVEALDVRIDQMPEIAQ